MNYTTEQQQNNRKWLPTNVFIFWRKKNESKMKKKQLEKPFVILAFLTCLKTFFCVGILLKVSFHFVLRQTGVCVMSCMDILLFWSMIIIRWFLLMLMWPMIVYTMHRLLDFINSMVKKKLHCLIIFMSNYGYHHHRHSLGSKRTEKREKTLFITKKRIYIHLLFLHFDSIPLGHQFPFFYHPICFQFYSPILQFFSFIRFVWYTCCMLVWCLMLFFR